MMIRFHKNGVTLVEDKNGVLHLLDPNESLRDVAKYIWHEESLSGYRIGNDDSWPDGEKEIKIVQLTAEKKERLRSISNTGEDHYFTEGLH